MTISLITTASNDNNTGTSASVTHGFTISSGDVIIASVHANNAGNNATDNNGSTPFTLADGANTPTSSYMTLFSRVCGASEPSSYAFTISNARWSVVLRQYRGVDSSVWDVTPAAGNRTTGNFVATAVSASITIVTDQACGLVWSCDDNTPTTTTYSSINNSYANVKSESGQQYQVTADRLGLSTGTLGATTITSSGNVTYVMWQAALKPAAASSYTPRHLALFGAGG